MNYEEKYKNALAHAREIHRNEEDKRRDMEWLFPELKESENEKIRQSIIADIKSRLNHCTHTMDDYYREQIAWLEKQESVGEIVERCKTSWYNEGKIQGQIEGLSDDEKYLQGWHDALEKQGDGQLDQEIQKVINENFFDMIGEDSGDKLISLNKACEWLEKNLPPAMVRSDFYMFNGEFINDFKKAMEE